MEKSETGYQIALAGQPNVGKSTVFNALTGLRQHTGNWAGKTVAAASGRMHLGEETALLCDLPGMYSLRAASPEEAEARSCLLTEHFDAVIAVCDACCLARGLPLVLQLMELHPRVLVCVNLMDEAKRRGIYIDTHRLSERLGTPAVGITARDGQGLDTLLESLSDLLAAPLPAPLQVDYGEETEPAITTLSDAIAETIAPLPPRWAALRLLEEDAAFLPYINDRLDESQQELTASLREELAVQSLDRTALSDRIISTLVRKAERIAKDATRSKGDTLHRRDRALDRIFLSRRWGIPVMLLLFAGILWLTMQGAGYPSALLSDLFAWLGERLSAQLLAWGTPAWVEGLLMQGIYRVLTWVIAVMLPPMAIFFPLFTLLEDMGYLPRAAFHLDRGFRCAGTCGKQALTMCMGLGCHAAGITGCRIIDSPRERKIAMLTNALVPCNGRFPMLVTLISLFFFTGSGLLSSLGAGAMLFVLLLCSIGMTFLTSKLLSRTLLRGVPSSFVLELPPYRMPKWGQVIVRSLLDRTIFVLGRACAAAAPAGLVIWGMAQIRLGGTPLLTLCADALDPAAQCMGLDGTILLAFLLGLPANEIVIPLMLMIYLSSGTLGDVPTLSTMRTLLVENGWTWGTALCTLLFSLFHFPCATACMTLRKETGSLKWTLAGILLPTLCGVVLCLLTNGVLTLCGVN